MAKFCGRCGRPTNPQTGICPACGAVTRYTPPEGARNGGTSGSAEEHTKVQKRHTALWIVLAVAAVLLAAAAVVGVLVRFGVVDIPAVAKLEERLGLMPDTEEDEPMGERQDIVRSVTASSYLPAGNIASYEPANVLDGDLATAWAEEKGAGETISFVFDDSYRVGGIVINAGYQKSDELYKANSRPARLRVTGDNGFEQLCALDDLNDRQEIVFDRIIDTRMLSITIEEVYEGSDYTDTCISEVAFLVGGQSGSSNGGTTP